MKRVALKGNIARRAVRSSSFLLYLHPALPLDARLEVGDLVRVSVLRDVDDGDEVWEEESAWWRGRVRFLYRSALVELPDSLLLPDTPGYRSREELRSTLSRSAGVAVDLWDTVDVVCIQREDYDLNALNEMIRQAPTRRGNG